MTKGPGAGCPGCRRDSLGRGTVWAGLWRQTDLRSTQLHFLIFYMTLDRSVAFSDVNFLFIRWMS